MWRRPLEMRTDEAPRMLPVSNTSIRQLGWPAGPLIRLPIILSGAFDSAKALNADQSTPQTRPSLRGPGDKSIDPGSVSVPQGGRPVEILIRKKGRDQKRPGASSKPRPGFAPARNKPRIPATVHSFLRGGEWV